MHSSARQTTRRDFLAKLGAASTADMMSGAPQLVRGKELQHPEAKADACIVLYLNGGPSHLDMWDMKPAGPVEIRGEFNPISTSQPGMRETSHATRQPTVPAPMMLTRSPKRGEASHSAFSAVSRFAVRTALRAGTPGGTSTTSRAGTTYAV